MQREGGWGFGPQMLEALAARDVGGLPSGWGFLPPPPPPRPGAPNDNTDEEADMQPAPEKEPEAEVETATHHQVRTIHTPMPPPVQSKARMHAALAMSMYYATCC